MILILTNKQQISGFQPNQPRDSNECLGIKKYDIYHLKSDYTKWKYSQTLSSEYIFLFDLR